jgi:Ca2+/H+ antiporter, TMEM165/GDT1 family
MEAFLVSTGVVALGEMGDKTQLLALMLAARFRKPLPIIAGIFVATLVNHAMAGAVGGWIAAALGPNVLRWVIGVSFLLMAGWMLIPDRLDDDEVGGGRQRFGVFGSTVLAFFLAEMGDKTQIATVALAARYADLVPVVMGTTLGMMLANVPAVYVGDALSKRISMTLVHGIAALIFAVLGLLTLFNVGHVFAASPAAAAASTVALGAQGRPLRGTYWKLVLLDNQAVVTNEKRQEPHLLFDTRELRVSGSGGCNRLSGGFESSGDTLRLPALMATEMACADGMPQESRFLAALAQVSRHRISGNRLGLLDGGGAERLVFEAVDLR